MGRGAGVGALNATGTVNIMDLNDYFCLLFCIQLRYNNQFAALNKMYCDQ